jgi:polyisoprenoid-binding protein YceI
MSHSSHQAGAPASSPSAPIAGQWILSGANSAECMVTNFGFKKVRVIVPIVEGAVQVDTDGKLRSVHALLQMSDVDTGNGRRDKDLAKPHLLDTARFPTMKFSSGAVEEPLRMGVRSTLAGTLEARGSAIPLAVEYTVRERAHGRLTVSVSTVFDRRQLGIKAPAVMIGREVQVDFTAEFELSA